MKYFVLLTALILTGCPLEENSSLCRKIMKCDEDIEMLCDKRPDDCGEDCHYYVVEHCYEVCDDGR